MAASRNRPMMQAGGGGGCERKNKYDEIYVCKVSVRNKNMEQK